ncbi:hypothetical protein [Photobacterium sp. 1_MG-2023]|uniref:hypothetical protein n=1 Tax=Photobacterium sp. 1_MG-2023 TaxID=3062646 RepID=UPI0026E28414|nr:hypothetical protein [Photobacterium sp. 1_MG-2023]MDO6707575.1 hypothetical protein [Photobacterium sp. 1_MG-2023]
MLFLVPIMILIGLLSLPSIAYFFTKREKRFVRFDRLYKIHQFRKERLSIQERLFPFLIFMAYFSMPMLLMHLKWYLESGEGYFILRGGLILFIFLGPVVSQFWQLYQSFRKYRLFTTVLWAVNVLLSVVMIEQGSFLIFLLSIPLALCWKNKTERVFILSKKYNNT